MPASQELASWPQEGVIYASWSDLLLQTQLAAGRAGWTGVAADWQPASERLDIRCDVGDLRTGDGCCRLLAVAKPVDPNALAGRYKTVEVHASNFETEQHKAHDAVPGFTSSYIAKPEVELVPGIYDPTTAHPPPTLRTSSSLAPRTEPFSSLHTSADPNTSALGDTKPAIVADNVDDATASVTAAVDTAASLRVKLEALETQVQVARRAVEMAELANKRAQVHLQGKDMAKGEKGPKPKKGRKSFGKQAKAC
ncbi:uncharacterized protein JCM10292_007658 [Rhodotorula paludigena]|uniref:uncharacterized protein n=1 Tax=Rhodotorula paludigena TaxID=86838 RepID=UPI0031812F23